MAVGVGAGLGALVLVSLYTVRESFIVVLLVFGAVALRELTGAFASRDIAVPLLPVALGGAVMLPAAFFWGPGGMVVTLAMTVLVTLIWRMKDGAAGYVRDVTAAVFTMVYLPFLVGFAMLMLAHPDGADRITVFIAVTVASDIGGFFVGAYLGRHKIAPKISPKKTWEGFAGSAFTCMLVGALLLTWRLDGLWWQGVILGACVVLTATLGDLVESMIKRDLGIKDLGTLLPGHGGVMDRLDSLLVTVPVAWILFETFLR
ncbi:phosphatidate cytidylyltransferase [Actinocorallia sp. A-T 12471]|uniref:phosphatidate cytidylyltransferase n=1 Tax=Actinocorallia sp. A-T 12471 TaxID=3089813 RepID=UPI0029D14E1C|nr:phosphatidate cytidylyltransferase [Actinocorallia sp. A-T 12471]MDX6743274.1 phosphatidate cytidylyltransferase [Actinocorallia sp. A-T 12471]